MSQVSEFSSVVQCTGIKGTRCQVYVSHMQHVSTNSFWGIKLPGSEAGPHLHLVIRSRMVELHFCSSTCLRSVRNNYLRTGKLYHLLWFNRHYLVMNAPANNIQMSLVATKMWEKCQSVSCAV
jgi:hypothetical protein